jgi:DNA-binding response OmpR family regulator
MTKRMIKKDIILIVDDDLDHSNMLSHVLRGPDYEVMLAQDGASALEQVQRCKPDLILLDIMMPDMDGFETATYLKAQAAFRDIPIIFLTALSRTSDILKGFEMGE